MVKQDNSSASQMRRAYILLLSVLMLVVSSAIIAVVGLHLYRNKSDDAKQLVTVLKTSFSDYKPDWDYWRDTASINPHNTFVRVAVRPDKGQTRYFYSHKTERFLQDSYVTKVLTKSVQIKGDQGFFYHVTNSERWKHARVTYEIWLSLNNLVELFKLIIVVVLSVTAFGLLIGIWAITVMARKLNAPLANLTRATQQLNDASVKTNHETLPVPDQPAEVHELSIEFNHLLASLNTKVLRDHQFVSDASHELRTPLAAIRGHVGLIMRHGQEHPEIIPPSLATIDRESARMQELVTALLRLSRMDHTELVLTDVDLGPLATQVCATYNAQLRRRLVIHAPTRVIAHAVADSVIQLLMALIDNADKYAPGQTPIVITVSASAQHASITVADSGPGIPDSAKPYIFDRFYRADTSRSHKVDGSGLGLAIAAQIAALNHATLTVADNEPHGSIFTLQFQRGDSGNSEKF